MAMFSLNNLNHLFFFRSCLYLCDKINLQIGQIIWIKWLYGGWWSANDNHFYMIIIFHNQHHYIIFIRIIRGFGHLYFHSYDQMGKNIKCHLLIIMWLFFFFFLFQNKTLLLLLDKKNDSNSRFFLLMYSYLIHECIDTCCQWEWKKTKKQNSHQRIIAN